MTSEREALIAGIRANPDDDLRRLVFADWLEEQGEPERAEFIRLQIEAARQYPQFSNTPYDERVRELMQAHRTEWFGPLFRDLIPDHTGWLAAKFPGGATGYSVGTERKLDEIPTRPNNFCSLMVQRGFGTSLTFDLAGRPEKSSIGAALNREPVTELVTQLWDSPNHWKRFTEPELRHILDLDVTEETRENSITPIGVLPILSDSHLAGVRKFVYRFCKDCESQPLPATFVRALESSPLGYRVSELTLHLEDDGLRVLARSQWLRLEKLAIAGEITSVGISVLNQSRFAPTLRSLSLYDAQLDDEAVAALARASGFSKLMELDLSHNRLTDSGLRALASARFLPQLEVLDLSENRLAVQDNPAGLAALAEALNPDAVRELRFRFNGYEHAPTCLAHLGDRVKV